MTRCFTCLTLILCLFLSGCATNYKREGGRWVYTYMNAYYSVVAVPIEGVDDSSFRQFGRNRSESEYAADKNAVYYRGEKITNALPSSFKHIHGQYWSDASRVYWIKYEIAGADPQSFSLLANEAWSRDDKLCFFLERPVPSGDPKSFAAINTIWARDAKHYYAYDEMERPIHIVPCDYKTMIILNECFAKDKDRVFCCGKEVAGADLATFKPEGEQAAMDKFGSYGQSGMFTPGSGK